MDDLPTDSPWIGPLDTPFFDLPHLLQIGAAQHDGPSAADAAMNSGFSWSFKLPPKLLVIGAASACCLGAVAIKAGRR